MSGCRIQHFLVSILALAVLLPSTTQSTTKHSQPRSLPLSSPEDVTLEQTVQAPISTLVNANQSLNSTFMETLYLDMHVGDGGPVIGTQPLESGKTYFIQVSGTWSAWYSSLWSSYCGPAEDGPVTPSPNVQNGKVGVDVAYVFAAPRGKYWCERSDSPPWKHGKFEISLNGGASWSKVDPIGNTYSANHVYYYMVVGQGLPPRFRLPDSSYDNYGVLTIGIDLATLIISHIEVTQAIQDTANSVPLIAGKPTFVRVYVDCRANCANVSGVLRGYGPSGELAGSPRSPVNSPVNAEYAPDWTTQRDDLTKTLNFTLPTQWTTGTITLTVQVAAAQRSETKTFQGALSPRVAILPIRYAYGGVDRNPNPETVQNGHWWASRVYPSPVDVVQLPGMTWMDQVIQPVSLLIQLRWQLDSYNSSRPLNDRYTYVFGWLPDGTFNGGAANFVFSSAFGADLPSHAPNGQPLSPDGLPLGPKIFAHEVGHLLGRPHTKAGATQSCANPSPDKVSDWPYPDAKIQTWGLDGPPSALKNPSDTYDYMSYCWVPSDWGPALGQAWTSPHTFTSTLQVLRLPGASTTTETLSASQSYLIASGLVYSDDVTALNPFWVITSTVAPVNPPPGTGYCLEAQNASGSTLASQCIDLTFADEMGVPTGVDGFYITLAYPPGLSRVVFKKGSQEIAARSVSANAPVVTISSPVSGDVWTASGTYTVSWTAGDADNDPLSYQVLYSPDGIGWVPVDVPITETQIIVNASELAGGSNARIRVLASDGVNTTATDSATFSVGSKGPQAFILSPEGDGAILPDTPLLLQGYAYDLEDGVLGESALQWDTNRDGTLGTGSTVLANLSLGQHTITLTATDSNGNTAIVSINVFGGSKVYLPLVRR